MSLDTPEKAEPVERKVDEKSVPLDESKLSLPIPMTSSSLYNPHTIRCYLDTPCPVSQTVDIADDFEVNQWVLNHLPFKTVEQRIEFVKTLMADQRKAELGAKSKEKMEDYKKTEKKKKKKKTLSRHRKSVKDLPTFS